LRQRTTNHEWFGMFLLLIGVVLVLRS